MLARITVFFSQLEKHSSRCLLDSIVNASTGVSSATHDRWKARTNIDVQRCRLRSKLAPSDERSEVITSLGGAEVHCFSVLCRRLDPYNRSYIVIGCLFAVGLLLIIIIVLSLIPLYISHDSKGKSNDVSVFSNDIHRKQFDPFWSLSALAGLFVNAYVLQVLSPVDDFNSSTVLDQSINQQALQAALTSLLQQDPSIAGAILEISSSRQASTSLAVICDLSVTSNRSCLTTACSNQFQSSVANLLTGNNRTSSPIRYEQTNASFSSTVSWLQYQLPSTISWSESLFEGEEIFRRSF